MSFYASCDGGGRLRRVLARGRKKDGELELKIAICGWSRGLREEDYENTNRVYI
jgi:hypothetical protein